jgi:hypothetical protein
MMLPIETMTSDLKVVTYIITSITALPIRLTTMPAIMFVFAFKTAIILYVLNMFP